jgi:hypothetical protein
MGMTSQLTIPFIGVWMSIDPRGDRRYEGA